MWRVFAFLILTLTVSAQQTHPVLALGSPAPNFELPGVDGAIHKLADYASSPILVVVFTCNHCPIAQMYETRIAQLAADYKNRGVALGVPCTLPLHCPDCDRIVPVRSHYWAGASKRSIARGMSCLRC